MIDALENGVEEITLTSSITLEESLEVPAGVTIDGDDHELKFTNTGAGESTAEGLYIPAGLEGTVTIKNLVIDNPSHGDNGIEIYSNATLENVTVKGSEKNGIYVNNDGEGNITVEFKDITTSDNNWAGIGLLAQKSGSSITANFTGTNSFGETPAVYTEGNIYQGNYTVTGLEDSGLEEISAGESKGEGTSDNQKNQTWYVKQD